MESEYTAPENRDNVRSMDGMTATVVIRLRGRDGQIAATDSGQALLQTGFSFPWEDEILVTGSGAFTSNDFAEADERRIGRSTGWVTMIAAVSRPYSQIVVRVSYAMQIPPSILYA